jgi:hypothetical protein
MQKKQKTLALAGAGLAAAAALGVTGATMAGASEAGRVTSIAGSSSDSASVEGGKPGGPGPGMRDAGGPLTADAASKAIAAAGGEVDGGTVSGVRAFSNGTYVVDVTQDDDTHVHVLLDASFTVTSVEERGMGRGPGGAEREGDDSRQSTDSTDANTGTATSLPAS